MTRTFGCAIALLLAAACGVGPSAPASLPVAPSASAPPVASAVPTSGELPAPPPKPSLAELIDRTLADTEAAWRTHDARKLAATYASGAEVRVTLPADPWTGLKKPALEANLAQLFATFPGARLTTTRTLRSGNVAASEGYFTGVASGKKVGCPVVTLSWFEDGGLVKAQHVVFEGGIILGQLGRGDRKAKVRAVEPIPTAPIVNVTAGATPGEARNVEIVKAHYASAPALKATSVDAVWGAGSFVVAEVSVVGDKATRHGVDVFELAEGQVKPSASYRP